MIFMDGSFANNADLNSQIGFIIMLTNETHPTDGSFMIKNNTVHWSSTKCKRVIRSVLASEIYTIVNGFDIGLTIATTLRIITDRLGIPTILMIYVPTHTPGMNASSLPRFDGFMAKTTRRTPS